MNKSAMVLLVLVFLPLVGLADGRLVDESKDMPMDGSIDINVVRGEVVFKGWDKPSIKVAGRLDEQTKAFVFDVDGERAKIEVRVKSLNGNWFGSDEASDLTIYVPASAAISFSGVSTNVNASGLTGEVEIGLVSGDVYLQGGASRITVQTVSGNLELHDSSGRVRVSTVSGDIETHDTVGDAEYSSVSGNIMIERGGEALRLDSVSGDIEIRNELMTGIDGQSVSGDISIEGDPGRGSNIEFDSVSGTIRARFGGEINSRFDIETGSGSIRNRISNDKPKVSKYMGDETLQFVVGEASGQVILTTRSGDISLGTR
jgi:DUF4097 and DUF4098 domain-containing protein YvlB